MIATRSWMQHSDRFFFKTLVQSINCMDTMTIRSRLLPRVATVLFALFCIVFTPISSYAAVFLYTFNTSGTLLEAGSSNESTSPYFWLNSGGKFLIKDGYGMTHQGPLASNDPTRLLYARMNPLDTGGGYYPQNTIRLITKSVWTNAEVSMGFKITKTNLTDTPNRDGYSGVFIMGRYIDQYNLYYVGVRHDGQAVIKKKINGTYYTLAEKQLFGTQSSYDKWNKPNLIPGLQWMQMRARFENLANGSVRITMYLDTTNTGTYSTIISTIDSGTGGAPLVGSGKIGIRTDFMDVQFENYRIQNW